MKRVYIRILTASMAVAVLAALLGCNGGSRGYGGSGDVGKGKATDEAALLRLKFPKDQLLRYDTKFKMNSDGKSKIKDTVRSVIYLHSLGPTDASPDPKFSKVNITRREVERKRTERNRDGRDLPPVVATRTSMPVITPNYNYDRSLNKNYFPVNARGMFGLSKQRPFHRVVYDSLVYLLPVMPPVKVSRGSTWTVEIPVYAGADYFYPAGGFRRGNDFKLGFSGQVEKVYYRAGEKYVAMRWSVNGTFDTQAYNDRFPARFHDRQRIIHEVRGSGRAIMNVTRGVLVSKNGQCTITFTSRILISRRDKDGRVKGHKWDEAIDRHIIHYECRLMSEKESDPQPRRR